MLPAAAEAFVSLGDDEMKWWKMNCDLAESLEMRQMISEWGWDWYGRYITIIGKILRRVGEQTHESSLETDNGSPYPLKLLARDLGTNERRLSDFGDYLAKNDLIDREAWNVKKLIFMPNTEKLTDEYTRKLRRGSGQTPEQEERRREKNISEEKRENNGDPPPQVVRVVEGWNKFATEHGLSTVTTTPQRLGNVQARLAEEGFDLEGVFRKISKSDYLMGKTPRNWRVTFDFVFKCSENYLKILEGNYDNIILNETAGTGPRSTFYCPECNTQHRVSGPCLVRPQNADIQTATEGIERRMSG